MLVLTRKLGERIMIDGGITITVVHIVKNRVKVGITAPRDLAIFREEILPFDHPERSDAARGRK